MSADKRTVTTDALETLGMIISTNEKRDAIHLAVEPIEAGQDMLPGQHVGIAADGKAYAYHAHEIIKYLGIVDPFLGDPVNMGEMFWLVVYPRKITSLRHVWTHPDFAEPKTEDGITPAESDLAASKDYIASLADGVGISYGRLIDGARDWLASHDNKWGGDYIVGGAEMEGSWVPDEFWIHFEKVTGEEAPLDKRGNFFSCSC